MATKIVTGPTPYGLIDMIIAYEEDRLSDEDILRLYQYLVDTGLAWSLQGNYGRTARRLIADQLITPPVMWKADMRNARAEQWDQRPETMLDPRYS